MSFFGCGRKLRVIGPLFVGNLASNRSALGVLSILSPSKINPRDHRRYPNRENFVRIRLDLIQFPVLP
jgi:tRNA G26 N,N-dimethylase Trm1